MKKFMSVFSLLIFIVSYNNLSGNTYFNFEVIESAMVDTLPNGDLITFQDTALILTDCNDLASLCLDVPSMDIDQYQILDNGVGYSNGIADCNYDTITGYSYEALLQVDNNGPYVLNGWMVNGDVFSGLVFNDFAELVDSMNVWDPQGGWGHFPSMEKILGGFPTNVYSSIDIELPDLGGFVVTLENGGSQLINPKGTSLRFAVGIHQVIMLETNTGCRDTFNVSVSCITPSSFTDAIEVLGTDTMDLDFSELPGNIDTIYNDCPTLSGESVDFEIINDASVVYTGTAQVGMDTACIIACDDLGFCDTTFFYITVETPVGFDVVQSTIFVGETQTHCIDTTIFPSPVLSIIDDCDDGSNGIINFVLDPVSYCVTYEGLAVGQDSACILVCDDLGFCDTTTFYITANAVAVDYVYDTIYLNSSVSYCDIDTTQLAGIIDTMYNDCESTSGEYVDFSINPDDLCANYQGLDIGKDTACLYLIDDNGVVDTTYLVVCVLAPETETIHDTLFLGTSMNYCLDTLQLGGRIQEFEFCENFSGSAVNIALNSVSLCVETESVAEGVDTACVVICDNFNVCDTTIFILTVIDPIVSAPPTATPDRDTTSQNSSIVIDVCANDIIPEDILNAVSTIISLPNGTADFSDNCSIDYSPETDFCGGLDSLEYVICNDLGCDTALVEIFVLCPDNREPMRVYNAISPNGDNKNDTFVIEGIENYPNHELSIFNRWGNRVFYSDSYRNDWAGGWDDGIQLPDGTYFYVIDDGQGNILSGYIHIQR